MAVDVNEVDIFERPASTGIQSIENGTPVLRALVQAKGPMSLTAIATATGMAPGKAHKYLASYIRAGMVTQSEIGGRYDLGPFALELGVAAMRRIDVMEIAQAAMDELRNLLGYTVSLALWANHGPTIMRIAETPDIMSLTVRFGTVMPLLTSSFGRIFAAYLDRRITQSMIQAELADPKGVAAQSGLKTFGDVDTMLAQFRARRMSVAENLSTPGRAALAAPIFDHNTRIVAAIAVVGMQGRLDLDPESRPARELANTARKLSQRLGASLDQIA
ncbi:MAG TPA: IclR family transcriptional regulator [Stellaceae bacterium]